MTEIGTSSWPTSCVAARGLGGVIGWCAAVESVLPHRGLGCWIGLWAEESFDSNRHFVSTFFLRRGLRHSCGLRCVGTVGSLARERLIESCRHGAMVLVEPGVHFVRSASHFHGDTPGEPPGRGVRRPGVREEARYEPPRGPMAREASWGCGVPPWACMMQRMQTHICTVTVGERSFLLHSCCSHEAQSRSD